MSSFSTRASVRLLEWMYRLTRGRFGLEPGMVDLDGVSLSFSLDLVLTPIGWSCGSAHRFGGIRIIEVGHDRWRRGGRPGRRREVHPTGRQGERSVPQAGIGWCSRVASRSTWSDARRVACVVHARCSYFRRSGRHRALAVRPLRVAADPGPHPVGKEARRAVLTFEIRTARAEDVAGCQPNDMDCVRSAGRVAQMQQPRPAAKGPCRGCVSCTALMPIGPADSHCCVSSLGLHESCIRPLPGRRFASGAIDDGTRRVARRARLACVPH